MTILILSKDDVSVAEMQAVIRIVMSLLDQGEFQSWFTGSAVVGNQGQPLVCYDIGDSNGAITFYGKRPIAPETEPVFLRIRNPYDFKENPRVAQSFYRGRGGNSLRSREFVRYLVSLGYDGMVIDEDGSTTYGVFTPTDVRPVFG